MNFEGLVGQAARYSPDIYIVLQQDTDCIGGYKLLYANKAFHTSVNCNVRDKKHCCACHFKLGETDQNLQTLLSITDGQEVSKTFRVSVTRLPSEHTGGQKNCMLLVGRQAGISLSEERERLYSGIAKKFIELSPDEAAHEAIREAGLYFDVDASYAARVDSECRAMDFRYVWRNGTVPNLPDTPQRHTMCQWVFDQLRKGDVVQIDRLDDLDPDLLEECAVLRASKTKACILVPVLQADDAVWFIGIHTFTNSRRWSHEDVDTLEVVGSLLGNAFTQTEIAWSLKETQRRFSDVGSNIPGIVYQIRRTPQGKTSFSYISQGVEDLTGWSPSDMQHDPTLFERIVIRADRGRFRETLERAGKKHDLWSTDVRIQHRNEERPKWVRASGRTHLGINGDTVWNGLMLDISEHRQAEEALRISEERLRRILGTSPIAIGISHVKTFKLLFSNKRLAQMYQIPRKDVIGFDTRKFYKEPRMHRRHWVDTRRGKNLDNVETHCQRTDGSPFWAQITTRLIEYGGHEAILWWAFDISEHKHTKEALAHLAHHDALTGLANRRLFEEHLHSAIALAARTERPGVLFYFDLDGFKAVNDRHGHNFGDWVLDQVGLRLRKVLRETDIGARLGGDEFAVIAHGIEDIRALEAVVDKMQSAISTPYVKDGKTAEIGLSIGVVRFFGQETDIHHLVMCADTAMYQAKQAGKGTYRLINMAQNDNQTSGS
jgi:diguanylate cyclase (GGDEF)-like protein/PAS domain S-box-containing protein